MHNKGYLNSLKLVSYFSSLFRTRTAVSTYVSSQEIGILKLGLPLDVILYLTSEHSRLSFLYLKNEVGIEVSQTLLHVKLLRSFDSMASQSEIKKWQSVLETGSDSRDLLLSKLLSLLCPLYLHPFWLISFVN